MARAIAAGQLEIVAVNLTDQERGKDVRRFVEQLALPFHVALDARGRVRERYGLVSLPTTVFVDSAGTVRARHSGPLSEHNLAEGLAAILPAPARGRTGRRGRFDQVGWLCICA